MEPMDLLADTRRSLADAIRQLAAIEAGAPIAKPLKREQAIITLLSRSVFLRVCCADMEVGKTVIGGKGREAAIVCYAKRQTWSPGYARSAELYRSPNGDTWFLGREPENGHAFIIHQPNAPSGGRLSHIELGAFLREAAGPEQQSLLRLIEHL
jgi:hypothetical protein